MRTYALGLLLAVSALGIFAPPASGQEEVALSGMVVSSSSTTLIIKTEAGAYQVVVFDRYTVKPSSIPIGATVKVLSLPSTESGVRVATNITVSQPPPPGHEAEPVPVAVRRLEDDIKKQARRYSMGFRGGASMDQETILVGVHAKFGPFFSRNLSFRPNVEFGFGEVTKLFAINLEGVYRLPLTQQPAKWSAYIGAGPSLGFSHRNFERAAAGENNIDFGDFEFNAGLNVLGGVEFRNGLFLETKATVYTSPHLRFILGYSF